jgi:hypothetical protein
MESLHKSSTVLPSVIGKWNKLPLLTLDLNWSPNAHASVSFWKRLTWVLPCGHNWLLLFSPTLLWAWQVDLHSLYRPYWVFILCSSGLGLCDPAMEEALHDTWLYFASSRSLMQGLAFWLSSINTLLLKQGFFKAR